MLRSKISKFFPITLCIILSFCCNFCTRKQAQPSKIQSQNSSNGDFVLEVDAFPTSLKQSKSGLSISITEKDVNALRQSLSEAETAKQLLIKKLTLSDPDLKRAVELLNARNEISNKINDTYKNNNTKENVASLEEKRSLINDELEYFPSGELNNLYVTLANSYCGDCLDKINPLTQEKLKEILEFAIYLTQQIDPTECVKNGKFSMHSECEAAFRHCSDYLSLRNDGPDLYVELINKNLQGMKVSFKSWNDYDRKLMRTDRFMNTIKSVDSRASTEVKRNLASEYFFSMCKVMGSYGLKFNGRPTFDQDTMVDGIFKFDMLVFEYEGVETCVKNQPTDKQIERLKELAKFQVTLADYYLSEANRYIKVCKENSFHTCSLGTIDGIELGGRFSLNSNVLTFEYKTKGGSKRTVTENDIRTDISHWRAAGMEEGKIVEHAEILRYFKACRKAKDKGLW